MDDTQRGIDKPRAPEDHDVTGTGTPRSADDRLPEEGARAGGEPNPPVTTGMETSSQPAFPDEVVINRSGSGGSGGPVESEPESEGSTGESMSELLAGDDDTEPTGR